MLVVDVEVAVGVGQPEWTVRLARTGVGAHEQGAAPAEQQRSFALRHQLSRRSAYRHRHLGDRVSPDESRTRVTGGPGDAHVEVAAVASAEPLDETEPAQRSGRELGAERRSGIR